MGLVQGGIPDDWRKSILVLESVEKEDQMSGVN